MIKVPKFLFYILSIVILIVCVTFCILAVINNNPGELVSNITLTITSVLGLLITQKEDSHDDDDNTGK